MGVPLLSHKEVAVQTESKAEPELTDAEVQTDSPGLVTEDIAQIDLLPVDRVDTEVQTDMEVMAPNEVCAANFFSVEACDDEATSDGYVRGTMTRNSVHWLQSTKVYSVTLKVRIN